MPPRAEKEVEVIPIQFVMLGWAIGFICGWFVFRTKDNYFAKMLVVIGLQMIIFFGSYLIGGG